MWPPCLDTFFLLRFLGDGIDSVVVTQINFLEAVVRSSFATCHVQFFDVRMTQETTFQYIAYSASNDETMRRRWFSP